MPQVVVKEILTTKKKPVKKKYLAKKDQLNELCERASKDERVVFEHRGKKFALIPFDDLELLKDLEDKDDLEAAQASLAEPGENIPLDVLLKKYNFNE